jgi:hypothetical protein
MGDLGTFFTRITSVEPEFEREVADLDLIEGEPVAVDGTKATKEARYRHRSAMKR